MRARQIDQRIMSDASWRRALFAAARVKYGAIKLTYVNSDGDQHHMQQYASEHQFIVTEAEVVEQQAKT
jgi:hypothetical protein